jgi:hypothetical protein
MWIHICTVLRRHGWISFSNPWRNDEAAHLCGASWKIGAEPQEGSVGGRRPSGSCPLTRGFALFLRLQAAMSIVKLANLNDFIAPAPLCIKPLLDAKQQTASGKDGKAEQPKACSRSQPLASVPTATTYNSFPSCHQNSANKGSTVRIELELDTETQQTLAAYQPAAAIGHFKQMRIDEVKKTATVSLNDCLACSGCVTSAETVLITAQSTEEFVTKLQAIRALGYRPPPLASLLAPTASSGATVAATASASSSSSSSSSSAMQIDSSSSDSKSASTTASTSQPAPKLCILTLSPHSRSSLAQHFMPAAAGGSTSNELATAKRLTTILHGMGVHSVFDASVGLDVALLEARQQFVDRFRSAMQLTGSPASASATAGSSALLPVLAGECPGWVCYAEKKEGKTVLPYIRCHFCAPALKRTHSDSFDV